MPPDAVLVGIVAGAVCLLIWLAIAVAPSRPWDLHPIAERQPNPSDPPLWPAVTVVVPARDETSVLPSTFPALLDQHYGGSVEIKLVDDRSTDDTDHLVNELIRKADVAGRAQVVRGGDLPTGWAGKVWALAQGAERADPSSDYLLFTDADIRHEPASVARLVAESEEASLALNSRMARLRCASGAERFLIPPFLFFFNLLYPMRLVNRPKSRVAAAAGGCMLLRRDALEASGGLESIRGEIIDDVNLAKKIKLSGRPIRLSVSESDVASVREYGSVSAVWRMVRRTAFDELNYRWGLLALTMFGLGLLFVTAPALVFSAAALAGARAADALSLEWTWIAILGGLGLASWALMAAIFRPTTRYFRLRWPWAWTLPAAGIVYGAITVDSALQHARKRDKEW